jgi:hypothetical protein
MLYGPSAPTTISASSIRPSSSLTDGLFEDETDVCSAGGGGVTEVTVALVRISAPELSAAS